DAPAKLLSGQTDRLDKWEDSLRIGPGWLGPNSPIGVIKALNGFAMQSWYYSQIHAIADNQPVNRRLGLLSAFMKMNGLDLRMAKAYLKALE
ncbi:MAG: NADH:flavin oxidoreductase, partial [Henriciella sp.]